jgi:hypothetical protein
MQNAAGMCCSIAMAAMCFSERGESKLEQDSLVFSAEQVNAAAGSTLSRAPAIRANG